MVEVVRRQPLVVYFIAVMITLLSAACGRQEPPPDTGFSVRMLTTRTVSGRWELAAERGLGRIAAELDADVARVRVDDPTQHRAPLADMGQAGVSRKQSKDPVAQALQEATSDAQCWGEHGDKQPGRQRPAVPCRCVKTERPIDHADVHQQDDLLQHLRRLRDRVRAVQRRQLWRLRDRQELRPQRGLPLPAPLIRLRPTAWLDITPAQEGAHVQGHQGG